MWHAPLDEFLSADSDTSDFVMYIAQKLLGGHSRSFLLPPIFASNSHSNNFPHDSSLNTSAISPDLRTSVSQQYLIPWSHRLQNAEFLILVEQNSIFLFVGHFSGMLPRCSISFRFSLWRALVDSIVIDEEIVRELVNGWMGNKPKEVKWCHL